MTHTDIAPARSIGIDEVVLDRARALVPQLRATGEQTEDGGRLTEQNVHAVDAAGLWGLTRPAQHGGLETNVRTTVSVMSELGRGCGATAWVVMISNAEQWAVSFLPAEAQAELYEGERNSRVCGTFAPTATTRKVDGGYIVNGAWSYASGCLHADWCFGGIPITDASGEIVDYGQALMPMDQLSIDPTWKVSGLKASGSHTVVAKDVFAPDYMVGSLAALAAGTVTPIYDRPLYRGPFLPTEALFQVAPLIGMAKAAYELTLARVPDRAVPYTTYTEGRNSPTNIQWLAEAATKIDTADLHLARVADHIDRAAIGEAAPLTVDDHARYRQDVGWITRHCREAVDMLMDANGSSGFNLANPVQRFWRDLAIAARHGFLLPAVNQEIYGRHLLGGVQIAPML